MKVARLRRMLRELEGGTQITVKVKGKDREIQGIDVLHAISNAGKRKEIGATITLVWAPEDMPEESEAET